MPLTCFVDVEVLSFRDCIENLKYFLGSICLFFQTNQRVRPFTGPMVTAAKSAVYVI